MSKNYSCGYLPRGRPRKTQQPKRISIKSDSSQKLKRRGRPPKKTINKQTQQHKFPTANEHLSKSTNSDESAEHSDTECQICFHRVPPSQSKQNVQWLGCDQCEAWFHLLCLHQKDIQRYQKNKHSFWKCPYCIAIDVSQ